MHNAEAASSHEQGDNARWQTQQRLSLMAQLNKLHNAEVTSSTAEQDDKERWHRRQIFIIKVYTKVQRLKGVVAGTSPQ